MLKLRVSYWRVLGFCVSFTMLLISMFPQKFYSPTYWVWKLRGWKLWIFSKRCLLTNKQIISASMWCVIVVLDIGNEYSGEWSCLLSHVLQRIIFQQSFMHSSHSSHLLGKTCCVHSFQKGTLFSWCSFQAWVKDIKKSSNILVLLPKTFIFLEVQGNPFKVKNQQSN